MENVGWLKLHRKLLDNPLMARPYYRAVWIEILLKANFDGIQEVMFDGKRIRLKPGQLTTGAYQLASATGVPRGTVERIIKSFKNEEQIEVRSDRQCSLITVIKWKEYQSGEEPSEERVRNDRGTSEERVRTNKEGNKEKNEKNGTNQATPGVAVRSPVNRILEKFQMLLNPTLNYGNGTQRKAAEELISLLGEERLIRTIEFAASIREDRFAPIITTPYQLKERLSQLTAYYNRNVTNQKPNIAIIS